MKGAQSNILLQVLEILSAWPLFGSSFFAVRREAEPKEGSEHILALNKNGVAFLDLITHETLLHYPFTEVFSSFQFIIPPRQHACMTHEGVSIYDICNLEEGTFTL